jgi:hypothetical protein
MSSSAWYSYNNSRRRKRIECPLSDSAIRRRSLSKNASSETFHTSVSPASTGCEGHASDGRESRIVGQPSIATIVDVKRAKFSKDFGAGDQT